MQPVRPDGGWTAVDEAVRLVGGPTKAANICHVSFHAIYKWRVKGQISDSQAVIRLSEATGGRISMRDLAGLGNGGPGETSTGEASGPIAERRQEADVQDEPPATAAVALVRRRFYAAPAVQRRRRHIQEKNVPFDWAA